MSSKPSVYGVRETLAALKELNPELRKEVMKEIRTAARPMAAAISANLPTTAPLSHMENEGRLGWYSVNRTVKIKVGGRRSKGRDEWPLVSLSINSAPAMLFDMAGKKSSNNLSSKLDQFGSASRAAWAHDVLLREETQKAILDALKKASAAVNKQLVTKGQI